MTGHHPGDIDRGPALGYGGRPRSLVVFVCMQWMENIGMTDVTTDTAP